MIIHGYAAKGAGEALVPFEYEAKGLGTHDVLIGITHCGICHTDLHLIGNEWGISSYPLVPGHEIVGTVLQKGEGVAALAEGERVGVSWQSSSCLDCEFCLRGEENLCAKRQATCVHGHGGFADKIVVDGRFVYKIPAGLDSESVAPLLCAGTAVYGAMRGRLQPQMRVGILGIGGLGHLAIQFARTFGCEVTAISSSPEKESKARALGADDFLCYSNAADLKRVAGKFHFLLSTVSSGLDWAMFIPLLRPDGGLCFVGKPPNKLEIPVNMLSAGSRKYVCGSTMAGRGVIREMLSLAARYGIRAEVESVALSDVNAAIERVKENRARYRVVLKT